MKRRLRTALGALAAVLAFAACTNNPSARTVAQDIIDGLDLPEEQRTCLRAQLDQTSDDQLRAVAAGNENANFGPDFDISSTTDDFQAFVSRLNDTCMQG